MGFENLHIWGGGWGDGSSGNVLAQQAQEFEFGSLATTSVSGLLACLLQGGRKE